MQSFPPNLAVTFLNLICFPDPQLLEQVTHRLHWQSTKRIEIRVCTSLKKDKNETTLTNFGLGI